MTDSNMSQKRIQNRDTSEICTHSSDMVERVADAILATTDLLNKPSARRCAKAALEASDGYAKAALGESHHAELVEALGRAGAMLACSCAATDSTMRPLYSKEEQRARLSEIRSLLAEYEVSSKIGGDA